MFKKFRNIPVHPAFAKAKTVVPEAPTMSASMAAPSVAQPSKARCPNPDHIPVPGFGRKPDAAAPAAKPAVVAEPAVQPAVIDAPVVEAAPVAPVVALPAWPDTGLIRRYVTNGNARVRFTNIATGKTKDFKIEGIRRQGTFVVDFYVYVQLDMHVPYGSNGKYVGCILSRDMAFRGCKDLDEAYVKYARFFGRWWTAIMQGEHLAEVTASNRESRAAEAKAARAAKKVAEAAAKWSASIAKAAANADGKPPSIQAKAAIHQAMKALKAMDEDKATLRNGVGFSKAASYHGHALADLPALTVQQALAGRILVAKYSKQLDPYLVAQALDEVEAEAA